MGPLIAKHKATWTAPKTNTDGSTLKDLVGYFIYWRGPNEAFSDSRRKDVGNVTSYDLSKLNLPAGKYYVCVSAYDVSGNESECSLEANFDAAIPSVPTGFQIS